MLLTHVPAVYLSAMVMTLIGFLGGALVLASFAGVALGRLGHASARYHAMNLAGALALVAAGLPARAWPSVTVNVVWATIKRDRAPARARSRAVAKAATRELAEDAPALRGQHPVRIRPQRAHDRRAVTPRRRLRAKMSA